MGDWYPWLLVGWFLIVALYGFTLVVIVWCLGFVGSLVSWFYRSDWLASVAWWVVCCNVGWLYFGLCHASVDYVL